VTQSLVGDAAGSKRPPPMWTVGQIMVNMQIGAGVAPHRVASSFAIAGSKPSIQASAVNAASDNTINEIPFASSKNAVISLSFFALPLRARRKFPVSAQLAGFFLSRSNLSFGSGAAFEIAECFS
jgi:hypothetical protein